MTKTVARELAHLENLDVSQRVAETVDWHTPIDLVLGDTTKLRERMLDFADPKRSPGFTPAQETAASERAFALLTRVGVATASVEELAVLKARLNQPQPDAAENVQPRPTAGEDNALDWSQVRAEACNVIGR